MARTTDLPRLNRALLRRHAVVGAILLLVAASACRRPVADDDGFHVVMNVTPAPPVVGIAQVEILLADETRSPLAAAGVDLVGNMTHPGMVPTTAQARPAGPGRWLADLELTMGGDWTVEVEARLADGRTIRRTLPLRGVSAR